MNWYAKKYYDLLFTSILDTEACMTFLFQIHEATVHVNVIVFDLLHYIHSQIHIAHLTRYWINV